MSYNVLYGSDYLSNPFTDDAVIYDARLTASKNAASYFDFSLTNLHPLVNQLNVQDDYVRVYFDETMLFKGKILSKEQDTEGCWTVSCVDNLQYLSDTVVRPYSTTVGEQELEAPTDLSLYFEWLIQQHNDNVRDDTKQFVIDINQANGLISSPDDYMLEASNTSLPTTSSEIESVILDDVGGYLFLLYPEHDDDFTHIALYSDLYQSNDQIIDFGVNITDFVYTKDSEEQYTAIRPSGGSPELTEEETVYQKSSSGTTIPSGDWYETELEADSGGYLWCRVSQTYSDGGYCVSYTASYSPAESDDDEEDVYSTGTTTTYCVSDDGVTLPTSGWVTSSQKTQATITAGMAVYLYDTPCYSTATAVTRTALLTGTYYLSSTTSSNSRYSISQTSGGSAIGWVDAKWVTDETTYLDTIYEYTTGKYVFTKTMETFSDGASTMSYTVEYQNGFDITVIPYQEGSIPAYPEFTKSYDVIFDNEAVAEYGYKEYAWNDSEITDIDTLVDEAVAELKKNRDPEITIDVKAVDLALYMDGYEHLKIGQGVRVRSTLHDIDEYLVVQSIDLDLNDPGQSEYVLGKEYDTLTGETSSFIESLNETIVTAYDYTISVSESVTNAITNITEITETIETLNTTVINNTSSIDSITGSTESYNSFSEWVADTINDIAALKQVYDTLNSTLSDVTTTIEQWTGLMSTITLGETDDGTPCLDLETEANSYKVRITNEGMYFLDGTNIVAYISNESLYITTAIIETNLSIGGNWYISQRANGNLGFRWLDD